MPLTKDYQRFEPDAVFGVINSPTSNILYVPDRSGRMGNLCVVAASEHVLIWNIRTSEVLSRMSEGNCAVTQLAWHWTEADLQIAAGYSNGWVRVFSAWSGEIVTSYRGHTADITALHFAKPVGERLVCGSKDTDITVLDLVGESGYRLKGHKGPVTQVYIVPKRDILISSSVDCLIKMWDLTTQHCFNTLTGHPAPVWDFVLAKEDHLLISGSSDADLRFWKITYEDELDTDEVPSPKKPREDVDKEDSESRIVRTKFLGTVKRNSVKRVFSLGLDQSGSYVACQTLEKKFELYNLLSDADIKKRLKKKQKKLSAKSGVNDTTERCDWSISDEFRRVADVMLPAQLRAVDIYMAPTSDASARLHCLCSLRDNTISVYQVVLAERKADLSLVRRVTSPGHRGDVQDCCVTADGLGIFTLAHTEAKMWSHQSQRCLATLDWSTLTEDGDAPKLGKALCCLLAPGDRHAVIGFETGFLGLFDLSSKTLLQSEKAHSDAVRTVCLTANKKGVVSAGLDKVVQFWRFDVSVQTFSEGEPRSQLSLVSDKTKSESTGVKDGVVCIKCAPNGKLIAVAMLNFTVRVFFMDSFKKFCDLYGHSQPVECLSISSDSSLLITGSGDKTVRVWGLQFGNCHKIFTSHRNTITGVAFLPNSLLAFSCDLGGTIKQWDTEKFREVITLEGHVGGSALCLAAAPVGGYLVSAGGDRAVRLWRETEALVVLEEEEEDLRERQYEEEELVREEAGALSGQPGETGPVAKRTGATLKGAERIMEALDIFTEQTSTAATEGGATALHPLMMAFKTSDPDRFIVETLTRIRGTELDQALTTLPLDYVLQLAPRLAVCLERRWEVELVSRCLLVVVNLHAASLTSDPRLWPLVDRVKQLENASIEERKKTVGFNLAALDFLKVKFQENEKVTLFEDLSNKRIAKKKKQNYVLTMTT